MVRIIYIVFVIGSVLLCCHSVETSISQRSKRRTNNRLMDIEKSIEKILEILTGQEEKTNRIHTMAVMNRYFPICSVALSNDNLIVASKYWKDMITQIKSYDQPTATEIRVFGEFLTFFYNGDETRLVRTVEFIKKRVEKGSALAIGEYKALLDAMDSFGHLYTKKMPEGGMGSLLKTYTYRVLMQISDAEGEASPVFNQMLPAVVKSILFGKEVFIRNNMTQDFLYAPASSTSGADGTVTNLLIDAENGSDARYIWKLKPVLYRWDKYNTESFYIENTFENKLLSVDDNGSLNLADATEETYKSTWSMFYIGIIGGDTGEEVTIHCRFWAMQSLVLDANEDRKMVTLRETQKLGDTAIWRLQPKV